MVSLKRVIIAFGVILFFTQSPLAQTQPLSYQSVLERLLDNQHVINIVDDFLVFWDEAKDQPLRTQRRLWRRMVENKHRDYFDRAVYRTTDPVVRREMLNEFLIRVPSQVDAIREFNRNITDLSTSPLIEAFIFFKARFRDYKQESDLYIGLSMYRFDGAVRPVQNDEGEPDTLCLGAEVLSDYTRDQLRVALVHEFFHLYHFSFLFKDADEIPTAEFSTAHIPLMVEGMAVAAAEEVFPYQPRELYLHFDSGELAAQQRDLPENALQFLRLIRDSAPPAEYQQWFTHAHLGDAPPRGGYLLGYEVVKQVMSTYGMEQMVRMSLSELREHAEEQLSALGNERVLLMALE
jgi:Predicted Zn-dependent protease (DUF2268)